MPSSSEPHRSHRSRSVALALMIIAIFTGGCGEDCPKLPEPVSEAPRSGLRCNPSKPVPEPDDPNVDPFCYKCGNAKLVVFGTGPDDWCRYWYDDDGLVTSEGGSIDISADGCYEAPGRGEGPLSGRSCVEEGATECSESPSDDPLFYVCRGGRLEVMDYAGPGKFARCIVGPSGAPIVQYSLGE